MAIEDCNFEADQRSLSPKIDFTRRGMLVTTLATGFAASVQPVMAQTVITTDTSGLEAGEVKIKTSDGEIPAYRAMPASGSNFPTILVVQEIFGVHEHIKDVCRRLAKLGYFAVAPEMYARQGDVSKLTIDDIRPIVAKVPDAQVMSDLDAAVAFAKAAELVLSALAADGALATGDLALVQAAADDAHFFVGRGRMREGSVSSAASRFSAVWTKTTKKMVTRLDTLFSKSHNNNFKFSLCSQILIGL